MGWDCSGGDSGGQAWYDLCIAADPNNSSTLFIGGVNTWKSTDGGSTWSINNHWSSTCGGSATNVHADKHNLVFQNGSSTLFECNDGGLYSTTNLGSSWTHLSNGMVISQMYKLGVAQTTDQDIIAGLQDNGTKAMLTSSWNDVMGGDGMECLIDYSNENTQYGSLYYGEIRRTNNHWGSSTTISGSIGGSGAWVTPYVQDPMVSNTLYVGYQDIWKSTNKGDSWTQLSSWGGSTLRSLAVAPSNSNYIYTATNSTLYGTSDGGSNWSNITGSLPVGSSSITYISVKNDDPNTIWISMGQFNNNGVFESTDGGSTWTNISTGLPTLPTNCVIQNRQNTNEVELYAGTDVGVYIKLGTANWIPYFTNMPNVVIGELDIYYDDVTPANSSIRAATYGRGLWESDLYFDPNTLMANFTADNTSIVYGNVVNFTDISYGSVTSWYWTFQGGNPATYSGQTPPPIQYDVIGTYDVTLTVCDATDCDTITKTDYINVTDVGCDYQIALYDSFGDGWNGGEVTVFVDGTAVLNNLTIASGSGPEYHLFTVSTGTEITTAYTAGGWSYENTYEIIDADGTVVYTDGDFGTTPPTGIGPGLLYGMCAAFGEVEGYVYDGNAQPIDGAAVFTSDSLFSTITDATGYYIISSMPAGFYILVSSKIGYNQEIDTVQVISGNTTQHDFTLTQPSFVYNPVLFDENLNPDQLLTTYLSITNNGDGDGDWEAVINYTSNAPGKSTAIEITGQTYPATTSTGNESPTIARGGGEPFIPDGSRDLFECNAGSLFGNSPVGADNAFWSQYGGTYQQYQQVNGVSGSWSTVTFWGVYTSGTPTTEEFFIGVYEDGGSSQGALIASYLLDLTPIPTGEVLSGSYPIYQYIAVIPDQYASDFWISCQATSQMYWLQSPSGTGNSTVGTPLAVCIEAAGFSGWLSLSDYNGTISANGGSQTIDVNFDATGAVAGEVYNAQIVFTTNPDVGAPTIPVTMTIAGGGGDPDIDVSPVALNISQTNNFTIGNLGVADLSVSSITDNATWLTTSGYPATPFLINPNNNQNVDLIVDWNLVGNTTQIGIVTILSNDPDEPSVTVTVTAEPTVTLSATPSNQNVGYFAGTTTFSVTSGTSWSVTDDASWLTVSPASGSNNQILTATYTANTGNERVGTITVSESATSSVDVTVTQAAAGSDHFIPIWTGYPYQPMNILLTTATVDGVDFNIGDEIGVFDVDGSGVEICVGMATINQAITSNTPLSVTVSSDDPNTSDVDGFTPGNAIVYRAWSTNVQTEYSTFQATYNSAFDNVFTPLGTALVDVAFISSITQTISLNQGWNIISYFVEPGDMNLLTILDPLVISGELTKVINEAGGFIQFIPGVGWMNTIGDMANTEGYYVKVTANTSVDATGMPVSLPLSIPLNIGWNIMGYPVDHPQDAVVVLDDLIVANELTKVINEAGGFIQFIPGVGWMNTIGNFEPGEGYYVKVNANTSLSINSTTSSSKLEIGNPLPNSKYFEKCYENNPYYPMNVVVTGLSMNGEKVNSGDELAVYDGNLCVGVGVVQEDITQPINIVVSMDDPTTQEIDGYVNNNQLSFKYMSPKHLLPVEVISDKVFGVELFSALETHVCQLVSSPNGLLNPNSQSTNYDIAIYPNPTQDIASIDFNNYLEGEVTIELMNLHGNNIYTVYNQTMAGGNYKFNVDVSKYAAGIYYFRVIYKTDSDLFIDNYKLVVTR